jgi:Asp-tRNA(Asn)/Glu-tRNA(Gln) amidotransferase A subunit family amidase
VPGERRRRPAQRCITWLDEPPARRHGPLAGKTLLVKDLIDTEGIRTTYGSRVYADHVPPRHATVVARVLAAGAAVVGKANLAEFAWGVLGTNDWYGTVHNPVRPGLTTGGSSSGNAAAIAVASATSGSARHRLLGRAARGGSDVGLKTRHGNVPRRLPALSVLRHRRPSGDP